MTKIDFGSGSIVTYTGRVVNPLEIRPEDISLTDIAHSLSNLCRFTGHTKVFYSVAEHSVRCYDYATEHKLWVLLHDASEAYVNDIARPLKHSAAYDAYRTAEEHIMKVIAQKYELVWPEPPSVKVIDRRILVTEIRDLMWGTDSPDANAFPETIEPWSPELAEQAFIYRLAKEGILLEEDEQSIEDFMKSLEDRFDDEFDDLDDEREDEDDAGGAGILLPPRKPKPFFGDALSEPDLDDYHDDWDKHGLFPAPELVGSR